MDEKLMELLEEFLPKDIPKLFPIIHPAVTLKLLNDALYGLEDLKFQIAKFLASDKFQFMIIKLPVGGGKTTIAQTLIQGFLDANIRTLNTQYMTKYFQKLGLNVKDIKDLAYNCTPTFPATNSLKGNPYVVFSGIKYLMTDINLKTMWRKHITLFVIDNYYALAPKLQRLVYKFVMFHEGQFNNKTIILHTPGMDTKADNYISKMERRAYVYAKEKFTFDEYYDIISKILLAKGMKAISKEIAFLIYSSGYNTPGLFVRLLDKYGYYLYDYNSVLRILRQENR